MTEQIRSKIFYQELKTLEIIDDKKKTGVILENSSI